MGGDAHQVSLSYVGLQPIRTKLSERASEQEMARFSRRPLHACVVLASGRGDMLTAMAWTVEPVG